MKKIIIFGIGDMAQLAHFYFTHDSHYSVVAFTVDAVYASRSIFCGLPVVPFETVETIYSPEEYGFFVAVSYTQLNSVRAQKYHDALQKGYQLVSYISSKATTWPMLDIGQNCFIFEDNTIQPFTKIGNNITLWSGNHIGHHSTIQDNCFISSHVVISGGVTVGQNCFIGVNSTFHDHITIGEYCVIAAGSLVRKNIDSYGIYIGQPAKRIKEIYDVTAIKI